VSLGAGVAHPSAQAQALPSGRVQWYPLPPDPPVPAGVQSVETKISGVVKDQRSTTSTKTISITPSVTPTITVSPSKSVPVYCWVLAPPTALLPPVFVSEGPAVSAAPAQSASAHPIPPSLCSSCRGYTPAASSTTTATKSISFSSTTRGHAATMRASCHVVVGGGGFARWVRTVPPPPPVPV
jgi:hypothetical protein